MSHETLSSCFGYLNLRRCPFCKTLNYAVEYRGVRTKEEKSLEQIEEQRVIEAKIRIRKQELQNEEERMLSRRRSSEIDNCSTTEPSVASAVQGEEAVTCEESHVSSAVTPPSCPRQNREDVVEVDLEDIMVMEAILRSIQEKGRQQESPPYNDAAVSQECTMENCVSSRMAPRVGSSSSSSGGLACAIAALAERQQKGLEPSNNYGENTSANNMPDCSWISNSLEQDSEQYFPAESAIVVSPNSQSAHHADCDDEFDDNVSPAALSKSKVEYSFQPAVGTIVPESFEEQMVLTIAVSLVEV
ncbi:Hypothetical predicted protein [Olea europaea subsp. europaea]|uniref:Uncharacterized protein n=1 Tax=Olea europaea subsp. europaea TaxID=158383 RepID=A0A8S0RYG8_OLEEU|nr:Hypothetical predicted protein [Olea europaea subsp. europaea]